MPTATVTVTRPFEHDGRLVSVGEVLTMDPVVALVKARRGDVSLTTGPGPQTYQTREMVAAPPVPAAVAVSPVVVATTDTTPPSSRTRSRRRRGTPTVEA